MRIFLNNIIDLWDDNNAIDTSVHETCDLSGLVRLHINFLVNCSTRGISLEIKSMENLTTNKISLFIYTLESLRNKIPINLRIVKQAAIHTELTYVYIYY